MESQNANLDDLPLGCLVPIQLLRLHLRSAQLAAETMRWSRPPLGGIAGRIQLSVRSRIVMCRVRRSRMRAFTHRRPAGRLVHSPSRRDYLRSARCDARMSAGAVTCLSLALRPRGRCTSQPAERRRTDGTLVAVHPVELGSVSFRRPRRVTADPSATFAFLNSSPRSGRSNPDDAPMEPAAEGAHR